MNHDPTESPLHHVWSYTDIDRVFWDEYLAGWLPQRIFDAHTHMFDGRFLKRTMTDDMRKQYWVNELHEPIGAAQADQCYRTVFPDRDYSCLAFGWPSLDYDLEGVNEDLRQAAGRYGWLTLAVVRPQWSAECVAELLRDPKVVGVKVYYALISEDDSSRDKHLEASIFDFLPHHQLEVLNENRSWVTLHVPKADRLGHPDNIRQVREIRRRYPDVKLVLAHLGRSYTLPHARESLPLFADDPGLLFDNSAVLNPEVHRFALETLGPERIVYGSDNPVFYMRGRRQWKGRTYLNRTSYPFHFNREREPMEVEAGYTLYMYEALRAIRCACEDLGLDHAQVEGLFCGNAERILERRLVDEEM